MPSATEADLLRTAQQRSDGMVDDAIAARQSVMVETVLSSDKFQAPVLQALRSGFEFGFVYVFVRSADLNVARVSDRVREGGHDVPEDRIRARRQRSLVAATWFARRATLGLVIDNTTAHPVVAAETRRDGHGWRVADPGLLADVGLLLGE